MSHLDIGYLEQSYPKVPDLRRELPGNQRGVTGEHRGHDIARRLGREQGVDLGGRLGER